MKLKRRKSPHKHTVNTTHKRYRVSTYSRGSGKKPATRVVHKRRIERTSHKALTEDLKDLTDISKKYLDRGKPVPQKLQRAITSAKKRLTGKSKYPQTKITEDTTIGPHAFTANFKYSDKPGDGESVIVFADTYQRALEEAYEERVDKHRNPIEVELVDPSIGAALSFLGRGAKSIGGYAFKGIKASARVGAKYAVKSAKAVPGALAKTAKKGAIFGVRFGVEIGKTAFTSVQKRDARRLLKDAYSKSKVTRFFARKTLLRRYPEIYDLAHFSPARFKPPSEETVIVDGKRTKDPYADLMKKQKAEKKKKAPVVAPTKIEVEEKPVKKVDYSKMSVLELKAAFKKTTPAPKDSTIRWQINKELEKRGEKPLVK